MRSRDSWTRLLLSWRRLSAPVIVFKDVQGHDHPDVASALNNSGVVEEPGESHHNFPEIFSGPLLVELFVVLGGSLAHHTPLLPTQGKYEEADPLYLRAIEIGEKTLGPDHPDLGALLNKRGLLRLCSSAVLFSISH